MTRQLTKSDLLIEQNKDGAFFYIRPDMPLFPATRLVSDVDISNPSDLKGFYPDQTGTHYENITVKGTKSGVGVLGAAGDMRLYDFTFFDTKSDTRIASAIHRGEGHFGNLQVLRSYANGQDKPVTGVPEYKYTNTDFFDNNNRTVDPDNVAFFRDITAHNFSDAIFDIKNVTYITNATITDAFRILRAHNDTTIVITNSDIKLGSGKEYIQLEGYNARVYYYNVTWDGKDAPPTDKIGIAEIYDGTAAREKVKRTNVVKLTSDPLADLDSFFTPHVDRYRAQISVNGDGWRPLDLPSDGWFGRHVGDTLVKIPDLGNGVYRIRAWAVDANGVASSSVTVDSFKVTTSKFNYAGGVASMDAPAPWEGTDGADRMNGSSRDDVINGGKGDDQISGNSGDDVLSGGAGDDVIDGGPGDDVIDGGEGDDILYGGPGDDLLRPGEGKNVIYGGEGVDTIDYSTLKPVTGGIVVDLKAGVMRHANVAGVIDRFTGVENAIASQNGDRLIGTDTVNRLEGGRGADVITGGSGPDVFVIDNARDFGADRITDFTYSDALWFTHFTDLGADDAARISGSGTFAFALGTGGTRTLQIGQADRWLDYVGENAEGYHVYKLLKGGWPDKDILPDSTQTSSAKLVAEGAPASSTPTSSTLTAPTLTGASAAEMLADFSATPRSDAGYVIDLDAGLFSRADAPTDSIAFKARNVIATRSNDYVIGDKHTNRLEGGQGDDVLTGGGGADVFVFDNRSNFGADRITDFNFSRALWFTEFTDLGADNVARIGASGKVWFDYGGGAGEQSVDIGYTDRWIEYDGRNAEGYHVYSLMEGAWPGVDILPL